MTDNSSWFARVIVTDRESCFSILDCVCHLSRVGEAVQLAISFWEGEQRCIGAGVNVDVKLGKA